MEPGHYTDPLEDALSHGSQRVAQFASLAGAMAQVVMQRRALHDARKAARNDEQATRVLDEQERLLHRQAKLSWASAHDSQWLAQADLLQTGRAWAGAASFADTDPAAASAMRKCEDRLRALHPYAMARYDRLREDGMSPLDAMRETAPLFGRPPDVRVGEPAAARPAVAVGSGADAYASAGEAGGEQSLSDPGDGDDEGAELRGRQIVERMQASARAARRPELGPDELAMVLEAATNLPDEVITRITRQAADEGRARSEERRAVDAERSRAADLNAAVDLTATPAADERTVGLSVAHRDAGMADSARARAGADRSAAQLAAESFPHSAAAAVQAAAKRGTTRPAPTPIRMPAPEIAQRPGRSM
jgi:hypothetical protein